MFSALFINCYIVHVYSCKLFNKVFLYMDICFFLLTKLFDLFTTHLQSQRNTALVLELYTIPFIHIW